MPIVSLWYFNIAYVLLGVCIAMLLAKWLASYNDSIFTTVIRALTF